LASELRSVLTEMLVDKRTTGSRRCHVALGKQGIEENVDPCTTLGREAEENYGQSKEIIETKPGDQHHTVHVNLKNAQGSYHWINRTIFLPASALSETKL